jgi:hypothetical protein
MSQTTEPQNSDYPVDPGFDLSGHQRHAAGRDG